MVTNEERRKVYAKLKTGIETSKDKLTRIEVELENQKEKYDEEVEVLNTKHGIKFKSMGELKQLEKQVEDKLDLIMGELEGKL